MCFVLVNKQKLLAKILLNRNMPRLNRAHKLSGTDVVLHWHNTPGTEKGDIF